MRIHPWKWQVLVPVGVLALLLAAWVLPPLPRSKVRAQRSSSVNSIPNVALTQPVTGVVPGGASSARP